jgi:thiamine transport system substrate-binding protein
MLGDLASVKIQNGLLLCIHTRNHNTIIFGGSNEKASVIILSVLLMNIFLVSCSSNQSSTPTSKPQTNSTPNQPTATIGKRSLRVLTHDSFNMTAAVLEKFKQENNIEVNFIKGGDAGSTLNKVLLSKDNPPADVLYGIDNTFLGRALEEGIFEPYSSPQAQDILTT